MQHIPNVRERALKDKLVRHEGVHIRRSGTHGYGVFTDKAIKKGEIVEDCPLPAQTINPMYEMYDGKLTQRNQNVMDRYRFHGPIYGTHPPQFWVLPGGSGMFFNNKKEANCIFRFVVNARIIQFTALRDIEPGEELFIDYTTSDNQVNSSATEKMNNHLDMLQGKIV